MAWWFTIWTASFSIGGYPDGIGNSWERRDNRAMVEGLDSAHVQIREEHVARLEEGDLIQC